MTTISAPSFGRGRVRGSAAGSLARRTVGPVAVLGPLGMGGQDEVAGVGRPDLSAISVGATGRSSPHLCSTASDQSGGVEHPRRGSNFVNGGYASGSTVCAATGGGGGGGRLRGRGRPRSRRPNRLCCSGSRWRSIGRLREAERDYRSIGGLRVPDIQAVRYAAAAARIATDVDARRLFAADAAVGARAAPGPTPLRRAYGAKMEMVFGIRSQALADE